MAQPALESLSQDTRDELAGLALSLSHNAKTRKGFMGLVKEVSPNTPIPELEAEARIAEVNKSWEGKFTELNGKFEDFKLRGELGGKRADIKTRYGLSDDDMKKMDEMIGKKELPADYEFAAKLFDQQRTVAEPTTYGSSGYGPFEMPKIDGLMENPDRWSQATAHQMIDDMQRKGKGAF